MANATAVNSVIAFGNGNCFITETSLFDCLRYGATNSHSPHYCVIIIKLLNLFKSMLSLSGPGLLGAQPDNNI